MERGAVSEKQESSYTYWVRQATADPAPLPVPKKLSPEDLSNISSQQTTLGSVWNRSDPTQYVSTPKMMDPWYSFEAGTWEEKNLNKWATDRIKELLISVGSLEFSNGRAEIKEVSRCTGDAFLVTVRNKKRVGYTYELTIEVQGEWLIGDEKKDVKGYLDIPEFSYGELDDLQMTVRLKGDEDEHKHCICEDLKQFLQPLREKLLRFEQELEER